MSQYLSDLWRPCRCLWSSVDKRVLREASKLRPIVRLKSTSSGSADTALSADSTLPDENDSKIQYDNAKPFHEIPGPKGMPYIGTMLEYTRGDDYVFEISNGMLMTLVTMTRNDGDFDDNDNNRNDDDDGCDDEDDDT